MREAISAALQELQKVILGKNQVLRQVLTTLLADGHILLDDVPGVGKTTLALALGKVFDLDCRRVQFTPDVLPSDLVGFSVYDRETASLAYRPGILNNANLLLGDEINRTSSKTQSALLEAMEERQITVDGQTYSLPQPFLVIATQNRVGAAGTQRLPFAQLDRFAVRLSLGYPDHEAQIAMLRDRRTANPMASLKQVLRREELLRCQEDVREVTVKDAVLDYASRLAIASREDKRLEVGISPRGLLWLVRLAQASAWVDERDYVTGADVQAVFSAVCAHRVLLSREGRTHGASAEAVLAELLAAVPTSDQVR